MIRRLRRIGGLPVAVLLAGLLLVVAWAAGAPVDTGSKPNRLASLVGGALPVSAGLNCSMPADGDVLQGPDDTTYLFVNGKLHAIPNLETLRALGFDPNGVDPISDECLRAMRFGEPVPSVGTGSQHGRSVPTPNPAAPRHPAAPSVLLEVSQAQPSRRTTVRLTARADTSEGSGLLISIHRTAFDGPRGTSGLVTTCSGVTLCAVEVWEDEPLTWVYVGTLYQCQIPGMCVAVQESIPVSVTWR